MKKLIVTTAAAIVLSSSVCFANIAEERKELKISRYALKEMADQMQELKKDMDDLTRRIIFLNNKLNPKKEEKKEKKTKKSVPQVKSREGGDR